MTIQDAIQVQPHPRPRRTHRVGVAAGDPRLPRVRRRRRRSRSRSRRRTATHRAGRPAGRHARRGTAVGRRPSRRRTGSRSRARRSRSRASRRSSTAAGPARSWRCPTTATAPRPPPPTSSSAPTTSVPTSRPPRAEPAPSHVGRVHPVPRSARRDRLPDRQRGTTDRLLTGGDIDPESMQRGRDGDLWVGDEFGPWILHFDSKGRLLDPPFPMPGGLQSPNNPHLPVGQPATQPEQPGHRGDGDLAERQVPVRRARGRQRSPTPVDPLRRYIFEFSVKDEAFTGRTWQYHVENTANLVADMAALDRHHLVLIERDAGRGLTACSGTSTRSTCATSTRRDSSRRSSSST